MNLHFAGFETAYVHQAILAGYFGKPVNALESFWVFKKGDTNSWSKIHRRYEELKSKRLVDKLIVDSGAHSIIAAYTGAKQTSHLIKEIGSIETFMERYLQFVTMFQDVVDYFFEVDTSPFTFSYEEQLRWRDKFYRVVKNRKQFMPVFHLRYEKDIDKCFKFHLNEYPYIGLGVDGSMTVFNHQRFEKYFDIIKDYPTQVHGLGITSLLRMKTFPWYSVDSTSYIQMAKTRTLMLFNKKTCAVDIIPLGFRGDKGTYRTISDYIRAEVDKEVLKLKEKYKLGTNCDLNALGAVSEHAASDINHGYAPALALLNMATYMEIVDWINEHGHDFQEKKQCELFDMFNN